MAEKPTTIEPKRRWQQFSLRTLLIGVTTQAIPFGYVAGEGRIVAKRKAWLKTHPGNAVFAAQIAELANPEESPSLLRRWLGDKAVNRIDEPDHDWPGELFPEARHTVSRIVFRFVE